MKRVTVVGIGLGQGTITPEASEAIAEAEVLFGAPRMLSICKAADKTLYSDYMPESIAARIAAADAARFVVLVSGDVGFYSAAAGLAEALPEVAVRFVPGISAVNVFFARLGLPWQDAAFVSAHGRESNIVESVRRNRLSYVLTGNNINQIGAALGKVGFGHIKAYVGENLGSEQEKIYETTAADLIRGIFPSLTVLLFVNDDFDGRTPAGLPDDRFIRLEGIPMTKSETRAVVLSKLNPRPTDICWDIGAGTGSVTVEMALSAYHGHIYAVECREDAISLIEENCAAFHIGNATIISGKAPEVLKSLPAPDTVFIGGSGGNLEGIIAAVLQRNPGARIVITAVTLEAVPLALAAFSKAVLEPDIVQLSVARGKQVGRLHLMESQNPITILSVGGAP